MSQRLTGRSHFTHLACFRRLEIFIIYPNPRATGLALEKAGYRAVSSSQRTIA